MGWSTYYTLPDSGEIEHSGLYVKFRSRIAPDPTWGDPNQPARDMLTPILQQMQYGEDVIYTNALAPYSASSTICNSDGSIDLWSSFSRYSNYTKTVLLPIDKTAVAIAPRTFTSVTNDFGGSGIPGEDGSLNIHSEFLGVVYGVYGTTYLNNQRRLYIDGELVCSLGLWDFGGVSEAFHYVTPANLAVTINGSQRTVTLTCPYFGTVYYNETDSYELSDGVNDYTFYHYINVQQGLSVPGSLGSGAQWYTMSGYAYSDQFDFVPGQAAETQKYYPDYGGEQGTIQLWYSVYNNTPSLYKGTVTAGGTNGTAVSMQTEASPVIASLSNQTPNTSSNVKLAVRYASGETSIGNTIITPTGATADRWALAPDNAGSPGAWGDWGAPLTISSQIGATNYIIWTKARSIAPEPATSDNQVDFQIIDDIYTTKGIEGYTGRYFDTLRSSIKIVSASQLNIAEDRFGVRHATYDHNGKIWYRRAQDGFVFGFPIEIATGRLPDIIVRPDGELVISYEDTNHTVYTKSSRNGGVTWS